VKSLLGAWAGKQKASSERAAEAARHLYTALKWLDSASQDFVYLLTALAEGTPEARDPFMYSVSGVGGALTAVEKAVKDIDPQLSIHFPEVARSIEDAVISRRPTVSEASNALFDYTNEQNGTAALQQVAHQAEEALAEIKAATEALRQVVAEQFSFKENF
jgi:hypothetical protein